MIDIPNIFYSLNYLMNLLTKLGILLVHIDQETILNYFGISNPNLIDPDYQILYGTMDMAPVSTNVSMETLRIIVQSVIDYSRQGLSLVDIENICLFRQRFSKTGMRSLIVTECPSFSFFC